LELFFRNINKERETEKKENRKEDINFKKKRKIMERTTKILKY